MGKIFFWRKNPYTFMRMQKVAIADNLFIILIMEEIYSVPLFSCSRSMDSNNALKLPAPKPLAPIR